MFEDKIEIIQTVFSNYFGNGRYFILFVIALLFVVAEEKKKENKNFLVYYTSLMFAIIFNPIFCYLIVEIVPEEVYYRFFWTIPMGILIAYFATILISKLDKKLMKAIISIFFIGLIMYAGDFVYSSDVFVKVDNWYKLPDEYVEVTEILGSIPLDDKKAMTSTEMVTYIRQLDASIKLAFPRRPYGDYDRYEIVNYYYSGDVENLTKLCKEKKVNIIAYDNSIPLIISPSYFGFDLYAQTQNYDIYVLNEK